MKKNFKYFAIIWFALLAVFNVVTFVTPRVIFDIDRFEQASFWIAYAFITLCLFFQLATAWLVCKKDDKEKVFLNIPLLRIGYASLIVSAIVAVVFMIIAVIPAWIGAIICVVLTVIFAIASVKAVAVADVVGAIDDKVKEQTQFMKLAVADVEVLMASATTPEIKEEVKKVYEDLRYSDYRSCSELLKLEVRIEDHIEKLKKAVESDDLEMVKTEANELSLLIKERNLKCKILK